MWQPVIAGVLVIAAAVYAARALGPRRWRRKARGAATKEATARSRGCGKDGDGCH